MFVAGTSLFFSISGGFINDICCTNYDIILYLDHHLTAVTALSSSWGLLIVLFEQ